MSSQSVYACSLLARALVPQRGEAEKHRFLVGTCSLQEANEVVVLEYDEDKGQLDAVASYSHPDQVWALETSPQDPSLVITCRQSQTTQASSSAVTLWRMPATPSSPLEKAELVEVSAMSSTLPFSEGDSFAHSVRWHPASRNSVLVAQGFNISVYEISESTVSNSGNLTLPRCSGNSAQQQQQPALPMVSESELSWVGTGSAAWDPTVGSSRGAAAHGSHLVLFDTRSMAITAEVANAHGGGAVRDLDFNPNKAHCLMSCGHDRQCKFWDLRNTKSPVKVLGGHSHWITCCRYNPFHDQLIVTGGCDQMVNLWRATSVSSAATFHGADADSIRHHDHDHDRDRDRDRDHDIANRNHNHNNSGTNEGVAPDTPGGSPVEVLDSKVRSMDQIHEDSVYAVAWSCKENDAWLYTSLSYDGRVVLGHVPSTEKYKILL